MSAIPTKALELMLAGWGVTHNGGIKVTFWLSDDDDLAYFKDATVRKGKTAGQRYQAVLVQLTDDDKPDPESVHPMTPLIAAQKIAAIAPEVLSDHGKALLEPGISQPDDPAPSAKRNFPTGYCGLAINWCKDDHFQAWLCTEFPEQAARIAQLFPVETKDEVVTKELLYMIMGIHSRKELDVDPFRNIFHVKIHQPYQAARKEDGVDG